MSVDKEAQHSQAKASQRFLIKLKMNALRYVNRGIWLVGATTIVFALYTSSFWLVSTQLVKPFEYWSNDPHWIRPFYNSFYYPLRWYVANGKSLAQTRVKHRYGWLRESIPSDDEIDMRGLKLETYPPYGEEADGSWNISIGFRASPDLLNKFDSIEDGTFIHATFGRALSRSRDTFINRLTSIETVELMKDPRIPYSDFSDEEEENIFNEFGKLPENCKADFINNYKAQVYKHCEQTGHAQNVGGGCSHVVGYAIHTAVLEEAIKQCGQGY